VFYLVDPKTGVVIEKNHCLKGKSIANKVLVFPTGKGSSVVQIDGLYQLEMNGNLPKAMIIKEPETVLICAAVLSNVPLVDRVEKDLLEVISTGDHVEVDSDRGTITLRKKTD
jgi:predicted aconitase subunit 2 (EC 4.2.1.3)